MFQRADMLWLVAVVGFFEAVTTVSAFGGDAWDGRSMRLWQSKYPEEFDDLPYGDLVESELSNKRKNGLRAEVMRWPDGVVPYYFKGPYTQEQCKIIESAFDQYQQTTCVRFRLKELNDTDYVSITNEKGCHAVLGRVGGVQILNIGEGPCISRGTVMHELMHVLGFMHEQKRYDRDNFIKVVFENLRKDKTDNFEKQPREVISSFGVLYDFESITHYSPLAFSKNGEPTVMVRASRVDQDVQNINIGQREYLSKGDILKVNRMYNCTPASIANMPTYPRFCS